MIQRNSLISTWRISPILCLTVGWTWQTDGLNRTTFGAFGKLEFCHWIKAKSPNIHNLFIDKAHFAHDGVTSTRKSYLQSHDISHGGKVRVTGLRGQEVKAPRFHDTRHMKVVRNILVLIFRGWVDLGHMDLSDASEKIPSDTTGDRFGDLPTRSALTTTLLQAPTRRGKK